jgi:hypothetical protein
VTGPPEKGGTVALLTAAAMHPPEYPLPGSRSTIVRDTRPSGVKVMLTRATVLRSFWVRQRSRPSVTCAREDAAASVSNGPGLPVLLRGTSVGAIDSTLSASTATRSASTAGVATVPVGGDGVGPEGGSGAALTVNAGAECSGPAVDLSDPAVTCRTPSTRSTAAAAPATTKGSADRGEPTGNTSRDTPWNEARPTTSS